MNSRVIPSDFADAERAGASRSGSKIVSRDRHGFKIFKNFPELKVGVFGKVDDCSSDEECAVKLGFKKIKKLYQVHGNIIHIADEIEGIPDGDGLITKEKDLALSIRFADCQAFVIYSPKKQVLAVLHAGWRGMAAKAITSMFKKLKDEFDVEPEETFVGAAPSLCKKCADFSDPKNELPEHLHPFIDGKNVDLQKASDFELTSLGVPRDQIERHPVCTRCGEGFWSWRRDKKEDARNYLVAGIT